MNLRDLAKVGPGQVNTPTSALLPQIMIPGPAKPIGCDIQPERERYLFPKDGNQRFTERVSPAAVAKVDAIREQAFALGWSDRGLYKNRGQLRFPYGEDYGLVCFITEEQRIGEVTKQYIEIVSPLPRENRLRFYNPDVPQP